MFVQIVVLTNIWMHIMSVTITFLWPSCFSYSYNLHFNIIIAKCQGLTFCSDVILQLPWKLCHSANASLQHVNNCNFANIYIYIYSNPFSCLGLLAISFDCRENNPFCNTVQSLHTQTHPYVGTHAPLCNNIRTTCAYTHAHSPTHPYTHSCHTYTHTPLQQYMHHLCTSLHLLTNIYKY